MVINKKHKHSKVLSISMFNQLSHVSPMQLTIINSSVLKVKET